MGAISFVVVSTPRSGTAYTAKLLNAIGVSCGHERYFDTDKQVIEDRSQEQFGDSSWLAAPFLKSLPLDTIILHQIRDPIKSINSLIYTKHLYLDLYENRYIAFINRHTPFPGRLTTQQQLAMFFWCYWHQLIEKNASGHRYFRYQVENIPIDLLMVLLSNHGDKISARENEISIPKDCNTRGTPLPFVTKDILTSEVISLATRYGYKSYNIL